MVGRAFASVASQGSVGKDTIWWYWPHPHIILNVQVRQYETSIHTGDQAIVRTQYHGKSALILIIYWQLLPAIGVPVSKHQFYRNTLVLDVSFHHKKIEVSCMSMV